MDLTSTMPNIEYINYNTQNYSSQEIEFLATIFPLKFQNSKINKFTVLACDASFNPHSKIAGIGVYDFCTKSVVAAKVAIKRSDLAEFIAIQTALSYAITKGYKMVRIIHDCQSNMLKANSLVQKYGYLFEKLIIEWRGRKSVQSAHIIAKQALYQKVKK